jgi:hypothetical protein
MSIQVPDLQVRGFFFGRVGTPELVRALEAGEAKAAGEYRRERTSLCVTGGRSLTTPASPEIGSAF